VTKQSATERSERSSGSVDLGGGRVFPEVRTKVRNYDLWQSGAFGNRLRSWRTLDEWRASGYGGPVALRELSASAGTVRYDLDPYEVVPALEEWLRRGGSSDAIMINEMAPRCEILQGEYYNGVLAAGSPDPRGTEAVVTPFFYSRLMVPMRRALRQAPERASGLWADLLLRGAMTTASHDDWRGLLDRYPDHVLEVSVFDRCLGDLPGRNALVWEVRRY